MHLQVFAVLENGVSKLFPRRSDTLRVLLILPNDAAMGRPESRVDEPGSLPPRRRRMMASLTPGGV